MRAFIVASVLCVLIFACKKSNDPAPSNPNNGNNDSTSTTDPNEVMANSLDSFMKSNSFQLVRYYSDTAIDYDKSDSVVKSETDLWAYVSPWLKDDVYTFGTDGNVTITQNDVKIPSDANPTLTRPYSVVADDNGVKITFLTNDYQALDYRLIEYSDTLLTVSAVWNGSTVKSDYRVIQ